MLLIAAKGYSQHELKGVISDENGESLIGANVLIQGTTKGTISDIDGSYTFDDLSAGNYTLEFSYIGYKSKTIQVIIPTAEDLNVTLSVDGQTLDEVIVVGYGVQRKREVTGNIAKVDGSRIMQTVTPSFESALQGQAAGVSVIQGSGLAGSSSVVRIRGISSISADSEPLYVIDGIPLETNYFLAQANWQNGAFNNNPLASLNPNDIESVEILKDAAAAGIYGSRGTNGVILITTKRGRSTKGIQFDFSTRLGTSQAAARPSFLNGREWLELRQEAWELDGNTGTVWIPNYSSPMDSEAFKRQAYDAASQVNTDWWDALTHTGTKVETNLGARMGNEKVKAYIGYTFSDNGSYIIGNSLNRHNVRANLDFNLGSKFTALVNGSFNRGVNNRVRVSYTGGLGDAMSVALPIYPIYNEDGTFWRGYNPDGTRQLNELNAPNPVFGNQNFMGQTVDNRYITNVSLRFQATERLNLTANGGYDFLDQDNDIFEEFFGNESNPGYRAERDNRKVRNYNANLLANYDIIRGGENKNSLKLLLGTELQRTNTSGFNNLVYQSVVEGMPQPDIRSTQFVGDGSFVEENIDSTQLFFLNNDIRSFLSFFTRLNYDVKGRYNFQASLRADGSSAFGANNRFGYFPTISAGWIVSEEPWFNSDKINFFKIKSSLGLLGNSNIPANQWIGSLSLFGNYNLDPIRYPTKLENPDLRWETTRVLDASVELGMWNDKLQIELGAYDKFTTDALLNVTVPGYYGFSSFWDNVAEIKNQGLEATFTYTPFRTNKFSWKTSLNMAYNYNEIVSTGGYLPDAVSGGTNDVRVVEGASVGSNFLIPFVRVDQATGRPIYLNSDGTETFEYDEENDRRVVGDVLPNFSGGWSNNLSFGRFGLDFLFVFSQGFDYYDSSSKRQLSFLTDWNVDRRIADRWRQPGDDARYPRVALDPASHGNDKEWFNTDLWLDDASYVRLRNINLNYQLPTRLLGSIGASQGSIGIGGVNLLTFTNFTGLDPEVVRDFDNVNDRNLSVNISYLTPPQERSYTFMLNLTF